MDGLPLQYEPSPDGLGDVHVRVRCLCPVPQVTLQASYEPQLDQPPFISIKKGFLYCLAFI